MRDSFAPVIERLLLGPDSAPSTASEECLTKSAFGDSSSQISSAPAQASREIGADSSVSTVRYEDFADQKKEVVAESITTVASSDTVSRESSDPFDRRRRRRDNEWRPALLQVRPVVGLGALCVTIACVFASLAVLQLSSNSPVDRWPIQPTVYLAIITATANSAIALAWMEAQPVSWWYSVARGRSIASLERQWHVTRSLVQAIRYCRYMSLLNIACVAAALVVVDGAFLQRASTVARASKPVNIPLRITLSPELPLGFTGRGNGSVYDLTHTYLSMRRGYLNNDPVVLDVPNCSGKCHAKVLGPGVTALHCHTYTQSISRQMMHSSNATWGIPGKQRWAVNPHSWQLPAFVVWFEAYYDSHPEIPYEMEAAQLTTGRLQFLESGAEYITKVCTLAPSILRYDIVIEDQKAALPQRLGQAAFVDWANNTRSYAIAPTPDNFHTVTMDGLTFDMMLYFETYAIVVHHMRGDKELWFRPGSVTSLAIKYEHDIGWWYTAPYFYYSDPTDDLIDAFSQYMLRAGALASSWSNITELVDPGIAVNQSITGHTFPLVYKSDLRWFAGAAAVEILTVLLILPMFYGWWKLGTNLSLSPFSFALAFDSPLLRDVNSASGVGGVVQQLGGMHVKFGAVGSTEDEGAQPGDRLGISEKPSVRQPREGEKFSS